MSRAAKRFAIIALLLLGTALARQLPAWSAPAEATGPGRAASPAPMLAAVTTRPPATATVSLPPAPAVPAADVHAVQTLVALPASSAYLPVVSIPTPAAPPAPAIAAVPAPQPRTHTMRMRVTAYCACSRCCGKHADGKTASGRSVRTNGGMFVAADTRILPFHTRVSIPGYYSGAPVPVLDRGKAIKGHRIDVFFADHEVARRWGVRDLDVTVYVDD